MLSRPHHRGALHTAAPRWWDSAPDAAATHHCDHCVGGGVVIAASAGACESATANSVAWKHEHVLRSCRDLRSISGRLSSPTN